MATLTTNLRLDSTSFFRASSSPSFALLASSFSSSGVRRGIFEILFRY